MVKGHSNGLMGEFIMENGKITLCMGMECMYIMMELFTSVNMKKIRKKVMAFIIGQMEKSLKVGGLMANNMA